MTSNQESDFNTNVTDKDERKKIRRRRIEKRYASESAVGDENVETMTQGAQRTGQQQVTESLYHLDRRKHVGIKEVTAVRVSTDDNEARRRIEDEEMRHKRMEKLKNEALASAKANAAIEMKWAELLEKEIPQELHHEIQLQMSSCESIISSKDGLISEFQRQLRGKDEEYVRALRKQAEDIEELLSRIRKEFRDLHTEYDKELDSIEDAFSEERDKVISDHNADMDELFDLRRSKEVYYKEAKQKREEQYQREVEELITRGADQYNKLKIELEMNIQTLKQQLEEIRATYQLNTEKLDYNYRVLTELDVEKNAELTRYKRRLGRLKEQLNHLVTRFNEMDAQDTKTNSDLTEDYRRLTQKYKDLQAKFRHFELSDTSKFEEVWNMHDDEAKDMVDQLLKADKVITEQQLGWLWKPPDLKMLQNLQARAGHQSAVAESSVLGSTIGMGATGGVPGGEEGMEATGGDDEERAAMMQQAALRQQEQLTSNTVTVSGGRIRAVLQLLTTEADFLLFSGIQQTINDIPEEEATLSRAENLLRALGVRSEEKLRTLVTYFFRDQSSGGWANTEASGGEGEELPGEHRLLFNNPMDELDLKQIIRPEDVIAAVKAFVEDAADGAPVLGSAVAPVGEDASKVGRRRLQNLQRYWGQVAQVVNDESVGIWNQLEDDLQHYKEVLTTRRDQIVQVDALSRKNAELKRLLNQYLGDRKNDYLQVPPSQTMRIRTTTGTNNSGTTQGPSSTKNGKTKKVLMSQSR
mmetsp:Transcript_21150/g.21275  ORF Transcript_21150/g.21275 Transcript_21150/m.21275 type:complete len:754 (+) Transcript_21150:144-2405(+)|eukprot:CAMPEP_0182433888 /NCGR_PEP_ID=MMETSP1167-20130531/66135_1 /TAXON_ID=2988 /ORGANISM="Mallomonas Sp, Strain CCMP3275" /LENGTH=753 /DNA_ID=CAMNT_0024623109 /DNA_START=48 /DNA_END=2309 /DNA_ORIENTATION=+